jgi:hypothetical protein
MPGPALTVPYPFDLVIGSSGYVFADFMEDADPTIFGSTPTFVPRQNTQGDYGDNQQDFWLTFSQKDWSKGEGQRYQGRDDDGKSRVWETAYADVRTVGQVAMRQTTNALTFAATPVSATSDTLNDLVYAASTTTLYHVDYAGTITSDGAHGLGNAPTRFGMTMDGRRVYLTTRAAGSVGVRHWDGAAFATFSATGADSLAFLNNTLYGYRVDSNDLIKWDSAGVSSNVFAWRSTEADATGYVTQAKLVPFGGKLLIMRYRSSAGRGAELWQYDGTGVLKLTEFPSNFRAYDCELVNGVVFVSGAFEKHISSTLYRRGAIYFYKDGQQDLLWQSKDYAANDNLPRLAPFDGGLIFTDQTRGYMCFYDPATGGITAIQAANCEGSLCATSTFFLETGPSTAASLYPNSSGAAATTTSIHSSLIDFDTSLRKVFRGVRVEFDAATDGNGGSVDIAYRFDNLDTALTYTTLQTAADSGTEYGFPTPPPGTTYQSVSVRVNVNKGTSTKGPVLKRVQVRAVPVEPTFKRRRYVVNLGGIDGKSPVTLRDGTRHAKDGKDMFNDLQAQISSTAPVGITDEYGTYVGVLEGDKCEFRRTKSQQSVAVITTREV